MPQKIEWQTPDHIHTEKNPDWYWIVGIVTLSIVIITIILDNLIFAILILISAIALSLEASRHAQIINISIDNVGVKIGETFYPYENLESFWIETSDFFPRILLKSKKTLMPYITILLSDADSNHVRIILLTHLREIKHSETLMEKILIRLGF